MPRFGAIHKRKRLNSNHLFTQINKDRLFMRGFPLLVINFVRQGSFPLLQLNTTVNLTFGLFYQHKVKGVVSLGDGCTLC